jgi:hypothetical protein
VTPGTSTVVLTAHVAHWADADSTRTAWVLLCLHRHTNADWGEVDQHDAAANDHALAARCGRLLSSYPVPHELTDPADGDDRIWIITDDLADPLTTILWPSDY